jgi:hypothetical protein
MTPQAAERWQPIKELAADAIALDPKERARFLATACADNEAMRREVEALATAHDQASDSLEPGHAAASVLARAGVPLAVTAPHLARVRVVKYAVGPKGSRIGDDRGLGRLPTASAVSSTSCGDDVPSRFGKLRMNGRFDC